MSGVHKYSAYEAATFILVSDSESNNAFVDESTLESSDSYDSEEEPCLLGIEVGETQENDHQVCFKNYYFFGTRKSFDVCSLFWVDKAVGVMEQFWNTLTLYYLLTILVFFFDFTQGKQ